MAFDVKKFLIEDLGLDEATATTTASQIKAERVTTLETRYRTPQEVAALADIEKTRGELAAANEKLNGELAEWATLTAKEKAESTELRTSLEQARVRATQLESRLTALATEHGVDPKTLLEGTTTIPVKKEEPVVGQPDLSKVVGVDQFRDTMAFTLDLPANLQYIQDEHFALTGKRLDTREIVKTIKENAGKKGGIIDPVAIWESKYGVPALREAKAEEARLTAEKAAEDRGYERARSEMALPVGGPQGRRAPVFGARGENGQFVARTSALKRPVPESTVSAAASALRTHKYRQAST